MLHRDLSDGDTVDLHDDGTLSLLMHMGESVHRFVEHGRVTAVGDLTLWVSDVYATAVEERMHHLFERMPAALLRHAGLVCVLDAEPPRRGGTACAEDDVVLFWRVPENGSYPELSPFVLAHELGHLAGTDNGPPEPVAWNTARQRDREHGQWLAEAVNGEKTLQFQLAGRMWQIGTPWVRERLDNHSQAVKEDWAEMCALWSASQEEELEIDLADLWPNRMELLDHYLAQ